MGSYTFLFFNPPIFRRGGRLLCSTVAMATGTLQHSAPGDVQGSTIASRSNEMRPNDTHQRDKHLVQSGRPPQRSANPFLVTERREEKQLSISSRSLHVNDFVLLKTLGTGPNSFPSPFPTRICFFRNLTVVLWLHIRHIRSSFPRKAERSTGQEQGACAEGSTQGRWLVRTLSQSCIRSPKGRR